MEYAEWVDVQFARYLQMLSAFYSVETRWQDLPFWARRSPGGQLGAGNQEDSKLVLEAHSSIV
jgi:hypothetical protein